MTMAKEHRYHCHLTPALEMLELALDWQERASGQLHPIFAGLKSGHWDVETSYQAVKATRPLSCLTAFFVAEVFSCENI